MAIGQHVAKALAEKAAREESVVETPKASMTQSDFLVAMQQLIAAIKTNSDGDSKERLLMEAERLTLEKERLQREMPENKQAPLKSVFNPLGDRDHPRPAFRCKTIYCGTELKGDVETREEIELLNQLQPGRYQVTKANGDRIPYVVEGRTDNTGALEQISISFPCKNEHRHDHLSMASYARQALGETIPSTAELMAELSRLRAELAVTKQGVGA